MPQWIDSFQAMLHDETLPPNLTLVLALGPKLQVKAAVERNLRVKSRDEYTSNEMSQLLADAVDVIQRSGIEYGEVSISFRYPMSCLSVQVVTLTLLGTGGKVKDSRALA